MADLTDTLSTPGLRVSFRTNCILSKLIKITELSIVKRNILYHKVCVWDHTFRLAPIMFADDTNFSFTHSDMQKLFSTRCLELVSISQQFFTSKLT